MTDRRTGLRRLADVALRSYSLEAEAVTAIRDTNNAVFHLATADGDYALRIHRPGHRSAQQTRSELWYTTALAAAGGVTVPRAVETRAGDVVALVETDGSERHASVLTWLPGAVRRPGRGAGQATLFRIGRALARIHEFSASYVPPAGFDLPTWDVRSLRARLGDEAETAAPGLSQMLAEVHDRIRSVLGGIERTPATFGILHHDFILLNCLHAGRRTAVIDFDDCGWGFYLQDLGGMLGNLADHGDYRSLRRPFLDGYRSVRPVPSERDEDLELMVALRHCTSALWLLDRRRQGAFDADRFKQLMRCRIGAIDAYLRAAG